MGENVIKSQYFYPQFHQTWSSKRNSRAWFLFKNLLFREMVDLMETGLPGTRLKHWDKHECLG